MATQTQSFLQGEVVEGKFPLQRYLGGSDHSAVFLTKYGDIHPKDAAIKLLAAPPGNAEAQLSRWRLAANFSHPHLIRILDMGRCQLGNASLLYVITELAGENLAEILPERALTAEEARDMLASLLDALVFMHSRGFVHGHIKPSNIMAVGEELKLSSDGICRLGEAVETNGSTSVYDPPEGSRSGATRGGDIWSLGVTLVEVLTREPPEWNASERRDPAPPETMPPPFPELARHCLRRDPKNRWSAATILAHLPKTIAAAPPRAVSRSASRSTDPSTGGSAAASVTRAEGQPPASRRYAIGAAGLAAALLLIFAGVKVVGRREAAPVSQVTTPVVARDQRSSEPVRTRPPSAATHPGVALPENAAPKPVVPTPERVAAPAVKPTSPAPVQHAPVPATPPASTASTESAAPQRSAAEVTPGRVLQRVLPDVPRQASGTIWGTVRVGVKVRVDSSGTVTGAELESAGPSRYFARLSVEAARKWQFVAPQQNGRAVASVWLLHFGYTHDGTGVEPKQMEP
jgi:TonB family protein